MIWLIVALLFLMTALIYVMIYNIWLFFTMVASIISQSLIFTAWANAQFGTIDNLIVLLTALPAIGHVMFSNRAESEQTDLVEQVTRPSENILTDEEFNHLTAIVQQWLQISRVPGKPEVTFVRLKQTGEMRTTPLGKWMDFYAFQYCDTKRPAFNLTTEVEITLLIHLSGRDKLADEKSEMNIRLLSLFNIENERDNERINSWSMIRYLGEICRFSLAALNEYIKWEEIDERSAKATPAIDGEKVSGI